MTRIASFICLLSVLAACGGDTKAEFGSPQLVSKDKRPVVWDAAMRDRLGVPDMNGQNARSGQQQVGGGGAKQVMSSTPVGWEELPANPARFRNAVWRVQGEPNTDCYLTLGVGGGVAGNLQRWYEAQFGKAETPAVEALAPIDFADRAGRLVELSGTFAGKADWGALIAFYNEGDRVTSLKFTGPLSIVTGNRKQFLSLATSIRLASKSSDPKAPPIRAGQPLPEGHAPVGAGAATGQAPSAAPFTATIPAGWSAKDGSSRLLHHTFGQSSEVYVSQLGGSLKQSLDIWRGEMGMQPMADTDFQALPKSLFLGDDAVIMDLSGPFRGMTGNQIEGARLLVAARLDGSTITFCKLVGPAGEVTGQRDAFMSFCGSIRRAQ